MARRNLGSLEELVGAMRSNGPYPCSFDASYVRWSFLVNEPAEVEVERSYFACLRGALGLTESEALDLIRTFYFGEGPYPL